jgi:hypothetical protein
VVVFNYTGRELSGKIVYYGPGLSGKTSNLEHLYGVTPADTRGKMVSMKTKAERTLFFDLLPVSRGSIGGFKVRFLLYTVPGQVYYNATRKLVLKGADGIVFVADSRRSELDANLESLRNLRTNLLEYGAALEEVPWVIQYNKRDMPGAMPVEELEAALNPDGVPCVEATAVTGEGVSETFDRIAGLLTDRLKAQLKGEGEVAQESPPAVPAVSKSETKAPPLTAREESLDRAAVRAVRESVSEASGAVPTESVPNELVIQRGFDAVQCTATVAPETKVAPMASTPSPIVIERTIVIPPGALGDGTRPVRLVLELRTESGPA